MSSCNEIYLTKRDKGSREQKFPAVFVIPNGIRVLDKVLT